MASAKQRIYDGKEKLKIKKSIMIHCKDKSKYCLNLYSKRSVKTAKGNIVGYSKMAKRRNDNGEVKQGLLNRPQGRVVGYIYVGENNWIGCCKSWTNVILIIMLAFVLSVGLGYAFAQYEANHQPKNRLEVGDNMLIGDVKIPVDADTTPVDTITFTGYTTQTVSSKSPYVYLENSDVNHVYMKYTIHRTSDDAVILESPLVKPGQAYQWSAYGDAGLSEGDNNLYFVIETWFMDTEEPSTTQNIENINITIK